MSGGTDSTLAAHLLQEAGADLIGFTMQVWPGNREENSHLAHAAKVAEKLGIPHHFLDLTQEFQERVIAPFIDAYLAGKTPSPCVGCNRLIKFGVLAAAARQLGCERLATGHYVRIRRDDERRLRVQRGSDPKKDQSYFLFELSQSQLGTACFPLGELTKATARDQTRSLGLIPDDHGESQDLCFIPDGDYVGFLHRHAGQRLPGSGAIVDPSGRELGTHNGFYRYTVGQRRGLGLGGGPWFVVELRPKENVVVVGKHEDLLQDTVRVRHVNWQRSPPAAGAEIPAVVQLRYGMQAVPAVVNVQSVGGVVLHLDRPVTGVTPGQAAVFYAGDWVAGGGWIVGGEDNGKEGAA